MKKVAYIIDSIGVGGGAEMLIADTANNLDAFEPLVITLYPYYLEYPITQGRVVCLHLRSLYQLPVAGLRLYRLLKREKIDLIHCNLFWSSVAARLFKPQGVKLVVSVHSMLSKDVLNKSAWRWLETVLIKRQSAVIGVSNAVLEDYRGTIHYSGPGYMLHNAVADRFFKQPIPEVWQPGNLLKCVAVGHFKPAKNYSYLLQAFKEMVGWPVQLDIFGEGPDEPWIKDYITQNDLNVTLRGLKDDLHAYLPAYDLFIAASSHEGYGIALAEAMACGLPCLVSDIPAFREVGGDACLYFSLASEQNLVQKIDQVVHGRLSIKDKGELARKRAQEMASLPVYIERLKKIYREVLNS